MTRPTPSPLWALQDIARRVGIWQTIPATPASVSAIRGREAEAHVKGQLAEVPEDIIERVVQRWVTRGEVYRLFARSNYCTEAVGRG